MTVKNPYGKRAKQLYKQLIVDKKADPNTVMPDGLKYHPTSQTFTRIKSKKPKIELRTSFKNYLGEFTIRNFENLPEYKGFELTLNFATKASDFLLGNILSLEVIGVWIHLVLGICSW